MEPCWQNEVQPKDRKKLQPNALRNSKTNEIKKLTSISLERVTKSFRENTENTLLKEWPAYRNNPKSTAATDQRGHKRNLGLHLQNCRPPSPQFKSVFMTQQYGRDWAKMTFVFGFPNQLPLLTKKEHHLTFKKKKIGIIPKSFGRIFYEM